MKTLLNMKKSAVEKTAVKVTPNQKATTTVANISSKVKTGAFGVATGAGIAGTIMMQNEKQIRNRKARAAYHKKVEAVCTVAVGAAVVGAGAAIVQSIFDPIVDVSMLEIEPASYLELNNKAVELDAAETGSDSEEPAEEVEAVEAEIVSESEAAAPASAPKAEQPIVEATATEKPASAPAAPATPDPAVAAPTAPAPADPAPAPVAPAYPAAKQPADPAPKDGDQTQPKSKNGNSHAKAAK